MRAFKKNDFAPLTAGDETKAPARKPQRPVKVLTKHNAAFQILLITPAVTDHVGQTIQLALSAPHLVLERMSGWVSQGNMVLCEPRAGASLQIEVTKSTCPI